MSTLHRVCAVLTFVGSAFAVALHFTGENLSARLFGPGRGIGSDALHFFVGLAALYVLWTALRPRGKG
jgi:uncharacterized membrane protein YuzA (DUF378 family)